MNNGQDQALGDAELKHKIKILLIVLQPAFFICEMHNHKTTKIYSNLFASCIPQSMRCENTQTEQHNKQHLEPCILHFCGMWVAGWPKYVYQKISHILHSSFVRCGLWGEKIQNIWVQHPISRNFGLRGVGCGIETIPNKTSFSHLGNTNQAWIFEVLLELEDYRNQDKCNRSDEMDKGI